MKRLAHAAGLLSVLGLMVFTATATGAQGQAPSIKEVMALHKGANSPLAQLNAAVKANPPQWAQIQALTKQFATLGAGLPKNSPSKGEAASWKGLADAYAASAKTLDEAARKMDLAGTQAALMKVGTSCMQCHRAHR